MEKSKKAKQIKLKNRITEIDFIRGIAVIIMIIDHAFYDFDVLLYELFSDYPNKYVFTRKLRFFAHKFWMWQVRIDVRYFILLIFLVLTGICCSFSRSNLKRGLKLLILAVTLSVLTYIYGYFTNFIDITIIFGILHCISVSLILVALIEKITDNKWIFLGIGLLMITVGAYILWIYPGVKRVYYGSENIFSLLIKTMLGIYIVGSDYYSLLFFGGQVFLGVFLGKLLYPEKKSLLSKSGYKNNAITFLGRHSLVVYIAHQVILPIIFSIILLCLGFKLNI